MDFPKLGKGCPFIEMKIESIWLTKHKDISRNISGTLIE